MKFITAIAAFLLAVTAEAGGKKGWGGDYPPIPGDMTVKEAAKKCGDQAQLSCCNRAIRAGDKTDIGGTLKNLIGGGSGDEGVEIFDQCSHLGVQSKITRLFVHDEMLTRQFLLLRLLSRIF
ncbi:hydrophobin family protein [Aspergillus novofumigatus IBT 16806]|uniref:Hydrophobin n=1 Tax=Aspergillus novofumigatus (strain IBT 16806) TaxID=1392255 RepID=A0A2I1C5I3_ASPN1|nr:uncharacterized protein P174DRAFT_442705 [Aspergillus novofumigatus IBT 16806]PKX92821.1 hypothetical protein P174DRAFT_442705 [Aspergillus novofumigatus IBT 16806]